MNILNAVLLSAIPVAAMAQPLEPLDVGGKLRFHVESIASPSTIAGSAAYAGLLQAADAPTEWGQGAGAYGKRFVSSMGGVAIYGGLGFALDSTLHEDPRYYRSRGKGFWRRTGHALRGTILTRTDSGGETLSVWRLGSAYGAAFLSNQWYPDRLNTVRLGVLQGSLAVGFGFVSNLGAEFWPDLKRKLLRR